MKKPRKRVFQFGDPADMTRRPRKKPAPPQPTFSPLVVQLFGYHMADDGRQSSPGLLLQFTANMPGQAVEWTPGWGHLPMIVTGIKIAGGEPR